MPKKQVFELSSVAVDESFVAEEVVAVELGIQHFDTTINVEGANRILNDSGARHASSLGNTLLDVDPHAFGSFNKYAFLVTLLSMMVQPGKILCVRDANGLDHFGFDAVKNGAFYQIKL